ncbi:MAG: hypothetical protein H7145_07655 [Akkermansiaceae bacterium]|nr:hypothetical protein [Armatimonadota bacterium]
MISATEEIAQQAKAGRVMRVTQTTAQNLQAVAISVASYEAETGHLPATTSHDAFKTALSPKFLTDTSVLVESGTDKPFSLNPAVSGKKRGKIETPGNVFLLATGPNAKGTRTVLFLSGEVRELGADGWDSLTAPQKPRPVPAEKSAPVASPAPSPR